MEEQGKEKHWSRFANTYDRSEEYVVGKPIIEAIKAKLLAEHYPEEVLEFGCGTGHFTELIAEKVERVIVTDLSDEMLEVARKRLGELGNVVIEKADCRKTAYPKGKFGGVLIANLLHVIDNPLQCLEESYRILRDGGLLLVVDFTTYGMSWFERAKLSMRYLWKWGIPQRGGRSDLSEEELVRLAKDAGFVVEKVELIKARSNALYLIGKKKPNDTPR